MERKKIKNAPGISQTSSLFGFKNYFNTKEENRLFKLFVQEDFKN